MSNLHIHIPHKSPSIQEDLNSFLHAKDFSVNSIKEVLEKIKTYLTFFIESFSSTISQASANIETKSTLSIPFLEQCLEEISFHSTTLLEIYQTSYLEEFDALKCFPLCELVIHEIIGNCIQKHKQII